MSHHWTLITQSHSQINDLVVQAKKDKDQVALYGAKNLSWTEQMEELQLKI